MLKGTLLGITMSAAFIAAANAQVTAPTPESSAYCAVGGIAEVLRNVRPDELLDDISRRCKPGDILLISAPQLAVVGISCDFSKTVAAIRDSVLCVYSGRREMRAGSTLK